MEYTDVADLVANSTAWTDFTRKIDCTASLISDSVCCRDWECLEFRGHLSLSSSVGPVMQRPAR